MKYIDAENIAENLRVLKDTGLILDFKVEVIYSGEENEAPRVDIYFTPVIATKNINVIFSLDESQKK